ncbi:F0F1 ATP synthase subunit B [Buchnera aphidicola (Macrosiphoniella sanborni)]|uniref:ATP synthase subunit b n=1 Tax=Buchnera aphidicola (Macrosiphoniella sanborni) TaxID=1241865 RepID=A0A4D6Y4R7_9GAMM|nr:F0F1 ATP synthase subunit B [Buchnera aphidicola]QCI23583.1 F0F1 ATP synthase subunit B [Buchnera aphidicola (Macrosiphoniella sanborni)]
MNLNATIIGQAISFFIFVWFCMKYVWPPIILAIETRQKEVKESLINAQKAKDELYVVQKKIEQNILESKKKASNILNEANKQKVLILDEARKNALLESKKVILNTQSEIDVCIMEVRKNLHKEIIDLSILIAEKIIKKNISKNDNQDFLAELVTSLTKVKN